MIRRNRKGIQVGWLTWILVAVVAGLGFYLRFRPTPKSFLADQPFTEAPEAKVLFSVQVFPSQAAWVNRQVVASGYTAPYRTVQVLAEAQGRVTAVGARRGSRVNAGDPLVWVESLSRPEELRRATLLCDQRRIERDALAALFQQGLQSKGALLQAEALLAEAQKSLRDAQLNAGRMQIKAPFGGYLQDRFVEQGDYLREGRVVAQVVDMEPLLVKTTLTEKDWVCLKLGDPATVELLTGGTYAAKVTYISPVADARTRLFEVELSLQPSAQSRPERAVYAESKSPLHASEGSSLALQEERPSAEGSFIMEPSLGHDSHRDDRSDSMKRPHEAPEKALALGGATGAAGVLPLSVPCGATARVRIELDAVRAHSVSPALLCLNEAGQLGVKAVDQQGKVGFYPVDLVKLEADQIWLGGLPERLNLISVGQAWVKEGQTVRALAGAASGP